jgi:hypothetical protein
MEMGLGDYFERLWLLKCMDDFDNLITAMKRKEARKFQQQACVTWTLVGRYGLKLSEELVQMRLLARS